jgi:hypothetical protein
MLAALVEVAEERRGEEEAEEVRRRGAGLLGI